MRCKVDEIAPDIFRLSTFHPEMGIQFNQFVVNDDEPMLIHTGFRSMFETTLEGLRTVVDPTRLRWIGFSHFEADECGALNQWLNRAAGALPVCGVVAATVNVTDYADRPPRVLADGERWSIGRREMMYLSTPHVPHGWDAGLFFECSTRTLFCSDLFFQPGDPPALSRHVVSQARAAIVAGQDGPLANDVPHTAQTRSILQRLADLQPEILATMHGASLRETVPGEGRAALLALADAFDELLENQRQPTIGAQRG